MTLNFTARFYEPYFLGLLKKLPDRLFIHFRYDMLDTYGFFKEEKAYYRGMFIGNASETRLFYEQCQQDAALDEGSKFGYTANREKLFVKTNIPLLFDYRDEQMWYFR